MKNIEAKADPNLIYTLKTPLRIYVAKRFSSLPLYEYFMWVCPTELSIRDFGSNTKVESLEKLITHLPGQLWIFKTANEFYKWAADITQE